MGSAHRPRHGSMQFWPRVRAKSETVRVKSWPIAKDAKPLGFAGYKVGMTHIMTIDSRKKSTTKGHKIRIPVTIIECPNLKVIGARFYKKTLLGLQVATEIEFKSDNKRLEKRKSVSKKSGSELTGFDDLSGYSDVRLMVHTLPGNTSIGKKTPEVFELGLGGSLEEKVAFAKEHASKEIAIADVFAPGELVDMKGVTIGKGFQGPVKRFGVKIRSRKSEKTKRGPGSISGGWVSQGHMMPRVAHAGQMGYHTRTEYNKLILSIIEEPEKVNPNGGFLNFGLVKNQSILVYGSVLGPKKRLIRFNKAMRPNKKLAGFVPAIDYISTESQQ